VLVTTSLALYAPALQAEFVAYDDPMYVSDNPHVKSGLNLRNICWAWTSFNGFYHPLTWISLQLDGTLAGPRPEAEYHLTNMLLHSANTMLIFAALNALTGSIWPSALAAALFAVHPLNAESVAWATERKGLLSCFFLALGLCAYARYVRRRRWESYLQVLSTFILGLLCKPIIITMPCILLLLDFWPLRRWRIGPSGFANFAGLFCEKIPLFITATVFAVVAMRAEEALGAVNTLKVDLLTRLASVPVNYVRYIGMAFWPVDLASFYPSRAGSWSWWQVTAASALIACLTGAFLWQARERPYLIVGWLWFIGVLFPVAGIFSICYHDIADRYVYVPLIGLCLAASWIFVQGRLLVLAAPLLVLCYIDTHIQVGYWQNNEALWRHALSAVPDNHMAHNQLGLQYSLNGRFKEGLAHLRAAVQLKDDSETAHNNLGMALAQQGRVDEASTHFEKAVLLNPHFVAARVNLATALTRSGDWQASLAEYRQALEDDPESAEAHYGTGQSLSNLGRLDEAVPHLRAAVRLQPDFAGAFHELGWALDQQNEGPEALGLLEQAVRLDPSTARYAFSLAHAYHERHEEVRAQEYYGRALGLDPRLPALACQSAWQLATNPERARRNGPLAVHVAEAACEATGYKIGSYLDVLAAAYAETGHFVEAVSMARQGLALGGPSETQAAIRDHLASYLAKQPLRQPPGSSGRASTQ
jgi:tetratricopeptide (TPR) repeat protein